MKLSLVYGLLSWTTGLYWALVKFTFPSNTKITIKETGLILVNQAIHSVLLISCRNLFSDVLFPVNFKNMLFQLLSFVLAEEAIFYYSHRLLHDKWFYQNIHYIHHQWKNIYSDIALYSHPVEHMINVSGSMILPILFQTDYSTLIVWTSIIIINTTFVHSGIDPDELHDIHHKIPFKNYGVLGLLDKFHNTYIPHIPRITYDAS